MTSDHHHVRMKPVSDASDVTMARRLSGVDGLALSSRLMIRRSERLESRSLSHRVVPMTVDDDRAKAEGHGQIPPASCPGIVPSSRQLTVICSHGRDSPKAMLRRRSTECHRAAHKTLIGRRQPRRTVAFSTHSHQQGSPRGVLAPANGLKSRRPAATEVVAGLAVAPPGLEPGLF